MTLKEEGGGRSKNCQLYRSDDIGSDKNTLCDQIVKIIRFLKVMKYLNFQQKANKDKRKKEV